MLTVLKKLFAVIVLVLVAGFLASVSAPVAACSMVRSGITGPFVSGNSLYFGITESRGEGRVLVFDLGGELLWERVDAVASRTDHPWFAGVAEDGTVWWGVSRNSQDACRRAVISFPTRRRALPANRFASTRGGVISMYPAWVL